MTRSLSRSVSLSSPPPPRSPRSPAPPFVLALAALAACGDDLPGGPDPGPDAGVVTGPRAVVVAGNFMMGQPGVMSVLELDRLRITQRVAPNGAVGSDPMLRKVGDELFVVNRADGNSVTILDAATFEVVDQLATGAGTNPQDVAVVGDKLYVPSFDSAGVVVVTRGSTAITTIDLSALDPDGRPNCATAYRVGADVYVACGLLDSGFAPRGPGKVVVIDSANDTVRATITLGNANPFGSFERLPDSAGGDLVIPTMPSFANPRLGCVERVRPGSAPAAAGCLVQNLDVDGFVSRMELGQLGTTPVQWVVASSFDTGPRGRLWGYDLMNGALFPDPFTPPDQEIIDIAVCPDGRAVVADRTEVRNGLRVYNGADELTGLPVAIGLRPGSSRGLVCY